MGIVRDFFSAYFLFWEILKLSLTFAVCGKRSLRSRRLEVVSLEVNTGAREGDTRGEREPCENVSPSRAPVLPFVHYFQGKNVNLNLSNAKNERLKGERL